MKTLPIDLFVEGKLAVVVGAGKVGARKVEALLAAGARVRVVAKAFAAEFDSFEDVEKIRAPYRSAYLEGARVVVAATDSDTTNGLIARDARAAGALVNVVDSPQVCDFAFPAVARKGPIAVAVSTGGASPLLAGRLKDQIAGVLDESYEMLARVLAAVRPLAINAISDARRRRKYFEALADDKFLAFLKKEGYEKALAKARKMLRDDCAVAAGRRRRDS